MCTLFANLCVINVGSPYGLHGDPYIFDIYMIRCGWLGYIYIFIAFHYGCGKGDDLVCVRLIIIIIKKDRQCKAERE